jgi:hypothetical protein
MGKRTELFFLFLVIFAYSFGFLYFGFGLDSPLGYCYVYGDELTNFVSGYKILSFYNYYLDINYNSPHPPIGKAFLFIFSHVLYPHEDSVLSIKDYDENYKAYFVLYDSLFLFRAFNYLIFGLSVILSFFIACRLYGKLAGLICSLLFVSFPPFVFWASRLYVDMVGVFFLLLAIWFLLSFESGHKLRYLFLCVLFLFLFVGVRAYTPFIALFAFLAWLFMKYKLSGQFPAGLFLIAVFLAFFFTVIYPVSFFVSSFSYLIIQMPDNSNFIYSLSILKVFAYFLPYFAVLWACFVFFARINSLLPHFFLLLLFLYSFFGLDGAVLYLFLLVILLWVCFMFLTKQKEFFPHSFLLILFLFYYSFFSLTFFGSNNTTSRYIIYAFVPFFILLSGILSYCVSLMVKRKTPLRETMFKK